MKKVIVLGSLGMAGHVVSEFLDRNGSYDVIGVARSDGPYVKHILDVTDFSLLKETISSVNPDYVINCVGSLVNASTHDICSAILINSYLPNYLADLGESLTYKLIHISTDCVFSGRDGGYTEESFRDGDDNYARTKALGEISNNKDLTIRTSIIGPELKTDGTGLLDWFLKQEGQVRGFSRAYWSGVTTLELAKAIHHFIDQDISGLFQLCPENKISKYDLLHLFSEIWGKDIEIDGDPSYRVDKSLVTLRDDFDYDVPEYRFMLEEMHDWMLQRSDRYPHYLLN